MVKNISDDVAKQSAERILEGYRKGGHICQECGKVSVWVFGCKEYRDKVKSLLLEKGLKVDFDIDGTVNGYCPYCRWHKLGAGLEIKVTVRANRVGKESVSDIVERVKSQLEGLCLSFNINNVERRYSNSKE